MFGVCCTSTCALVTPFKNGLSASSWLKNRRRRGSRMVRKQQGPERKVENVSLGNYRPKQGAHLLEYYTPIFNTENTRSHVPHNRTFGPKGFVSLG